MEWALLPLKKYAQFEGRSRRKEYWSFFLLSLGVSFVLGLIEGLLGGPGVMQFIVALAMAVPSLAVGVRRLHDTDRSGWWTLIGLLPVVGWIILIVFLAQRGQVGANRFGPDPIAEPIEVVA